MDSKPRDISPALPAFLSDQVQYTEAQPTIVGWASASIFHDQVPNAWAPGFGEELVANCLAPVPHQLSVDDGTA